jgi:hypothetical protein
MPHNLSSVAVLYPKNMPRYVTGIIRRTFLLFHSRPRDPFLSAATMCKCEAKHLSRSSQQADNCQANDLGQLLEPNSMAAHLASYRKLDALQHNLIMLPGASHAAVAMVTKR